MTNLCDINEGVQIALEIPRDMNPVNIIFQAVVKNWGLKSRELIRLLPLNYLTCALSFASAHFTHLSHNSPTAILE